MNNVPHSKERRSTRYLNKISLDSRVLSTVEADVWFGGHIREKEVVHPAAKLFVMASQAQEAEVC